MVVANWWMNLFDINDNHNKMRNKRGNGKFSTTNRHFTEVFFVPKLPCHTSSFMVSCSQTAADTYAPLFAFTHHVKLDNKNMNIIIIVKIICRKNTVLHSVKIVTRTPLKDLCSVHRC